MHPANETSAVAVNSQRTELSRLVKNWASELGFDLVGIAESQPLDNEAKLLNKWLSNACHAGMSWLANNPDKRTDPRKILEGCRSVIVVGAGYNQPHIDSTQSTDVEGSPTGRIARYAQQADYHLHIGNRLEELTRRIKHMGGQTTLTRWYVDTGPVMEKAWAARAGLGFIGRNTCLIHPDRGSWFNLGAVLTTLELSYNQPVEQSCGECRLCLDACPTNAITEHGFLDANCCISYLTIEHRGEIDAKLASCFEGWLFGCDLCQEVCPYNNPLEIGDFSHSRAEPYTKPSVSLKDILEIESEAHLITAFGQESPLIRTGLDRVKRTARILLSSINSH